MGAKDISLRIYLASGFNWRHNFRALAKNIEAKGHRVTSCWITLDERPERNSEDWDNFASRIAVHNLTDLNDSDALVLDTRGIRKDGNGGAWSELGFAIARNWPVYLIGPKTNTFLWLEGITWVEDEYELLMKL